MYGSFIPLQKTDVLKHLRRKFNTDFSNRFVGDWGGGVLLAKHFLQIVFYFPKLQQKCHLPGSGQIPNRDRSEICALLSGGLQETHADPGRPVYAG